MRELFIVPGYGIPQDILKDGNCNRYLPAVFNVIHRAVADRWVQPIIVFTGGPTDMFPPFRRTEAAEMLRFIRRHISTRYPRGAAKEKWELVLERRSISTLENLLNVQRLLTRRRISSLPKTVFCEWTRQTRIRSLAWRILGRGVNVVPIDFDVSVNRYLDPKKIAFKEKQSLHIDLRALEDASKLRKHHSAYANRLEWLREAGPKHHAEAVKRWNEEELPKLLQS